MSVLYSQYGTIVRGGGGGYTPKFGTIDLWGKIYDTVTINGLVWLCQNLDYQWEGLPIQRTSGNNSPEACYTEQNESIWGWNGRKGGLQYNTKAKEYLQETILQDSPWRVPSISDVCKLIDSVGIENSSLDLGGTSDWGTYQGNNTIGFNELPFGGWANPGEPPGNYWYMGVYEQGQTNKFAFNSTGYNNLPNSVVIGDYTPYSWHVTLRLCKDA